jgi:hypothetical protein
MRWQGLLAACAIGLVAATVAATEQDDLKAPWVRAGDAVPANKCRVSRDNLAGPGFTKSLTIRCSDTSSGFVSVNQAISAADYRGKRIRLSAQLRGESVRGWSGLYLAIYGTRPGDTLAFDNMQERAPKGTFDWQAASVVLDVPQEANMIGLGFLQSGDGVSSTGAIALDIVDASVPTTDKGSPGRNLPKAPDLSLGW